MTIRTIFQQSLWLLIVVAMGILSCTDDSVLMTGNGSDKALVKLEVRVPGGTVRTSRALQTQHEDEVSEIVVLAFDKGSDSHWDTPLRHVGKSINISQGTGNIKQFTIELQSGQWDLWVLANAEETIHKLEDIIGIDIYSPEFLTLGFTKSDLQSALTLDIIKKWNTDSNDANHAYRIPMWGMLNEVQVQSSSTGIIKRVNLYRMLVKIDIEVQRTEDSGEPNKYPGISMENFELTHVSLHNYNRTGQLIPGITATDGNWTTPGGGSALRTTLPENPHGLYGWEPDKRLEWSNPTDFTTPGTALNGMIYTVEADRGTTSDNRPCIIIGGKYNESSEVTYYRTDFLDTNKNPLDLLRNHRYKLLIRKIGGKGFSTIEKAYKAGPTQLETEVIEWNEGGYLEGVWNGTHAIQISGTEVHFTQFGTPNPQEIKIRSNIPALTAEDFTDIETGQSDGEWHPVTANSWSNGHFNVEIEKVATIDGYSEYLLSITAAAASQGDPARQTTFVITGSALEVKINISQDQNMEYQLRTSPDASLPITIDGARQLIKIEVMSTHPYVVDYEEYPIFLNLYEDAAGTRPIPDHTNIPANITEVYLEVDEYYSFEARMGEFLIRHVADESRATARIYRVLQNSPVIMTTFEDGTYSQSVKREGGLVEIIVYSNMATWHPVLSINGVPYEGDLSTYFSITNGIRSQYVTFRVPKMEESETTDKLYSITFRGIDPDIETNPGVTVTQKALQVTPPDTGVTSFENILAVDSNGVLNLDGRGYIVYFKWGSLIGILGSPDPFNASHIAWAPAGYDVSAIGNNWNNIQYATTSAFPTTIPATGLGDPCTLASKDGVVGGWMMPGGTSWPDPINTLSSGWTSRKVGDVDIYGRMNQAKTMFYPAAGQRVSGNGVTEMNEKGYYWTSGAAGTYSGRAMSFGSNSYDELSKGRAQAFPIRCVRK